MSRWWGVLLSLLAPVVAQAWGSPPHVAQSCNNNVGQLHIQAAVNAAQAVGPGEVVQLPAGNCTVSVHIDVTKGMKFIGAGAPGTANPKLDHAEADNPAIHTLITDNVPKPNGAQVQSMIRFLVAAQDLEVGYFKVIGGVADTNCGPNGAPCWNVGHVVVQGSPTNLRIHHIATSVPQTSLLRVFLSVSGLIDHLNFTGGRNVQTVVVEMGSWGGLSNGNGSWLQGVNWGSSEFLFIEDSYVEGPSQYQGGAGITDCLNGGRVVARWNTMVNTNFGSHGTDSSAHRRSCRAFEIYENELTLTTPFGIRFFWNRGGEATVHNNRVFSATPLNGMVTTGNDRDGTQTVAYWGSCNGQSPYDENRQGETGYRCIDQPGAGTATQAYTGAPPGNPIPAAPAGNILAPTYIWDNLEDGVSNNTGGSSQHVIDGRDVFRGVARPGYLRYVYPHPSQGGAVTPAAPTGFEIVP